MGKGYVRANTIITNLLHIHLVVSVCPNPGIHASLLSFRFTGSIDSGTVGGAADSVDGVISTRRGNAGSWLAMIGKAPVGEWVLSLPNTEDMKARFAKEDIRDILLVLTYSGRAPQWPS